MKQQNSWATFWRPREIADFRLEKLQQSKISGSSISAVNLGNRSEARILCYHFLVLLRTGFVTFLQALISQGLPVSHFHVFAVACDALCHLLEHCSNRNTPCLVLWKTLLVSEALKPCAKTTLVLVTNSLRLTLPLMATWTTPSPCLKSQSSWPKLGIKLNSVIIREEDEMKKLELPWERFSLLFLLHFVCWFDKDKKVAEAVLYV